MSPHSFLISILCFPFFQVGLARNLLIIFIFFRELAVVSLIFSIVFMLFISLITAHIFIISFLLLTLGYICSSTFFNMETEVIYLRSSFLIQAFSALNFPLSSALGAFHRFWYVIFSFSFSIKYFISFWFLFCSMGYFEMCSFPDFGVFSLIGF